MSSLPCRSNGMAGGGNRVDMEDRYNCEDNISIKSRFQRFSDVPTTIDIAISEGGDTEEAVEVDLTTLDDDPSELCMLLENEKISKDTWMWIALAYAKQGKLDLSISVLTQSLKSISSAKLDDRVNLLNALCWTYLGKCRESPRVHIEGANVKTKEDYIGLAMATLNEASQLKPNYPPLSLSWGVLSLLKASLFGPTRGLSTSVNDSERMNTLHQALKSFEDSLRYSNGMNLMAMLGRARVLYSMARYGEALKGYQNVLEKAPDLLSPDPRIGIGCCLWKLGYKDGAKVAWDRAVSLNPDSKIANILLGIYYLQYSSQYSTNEPEFAESYKKAMTEYTQKAFKLPGGENFPLICATFGGYFLMRKAMTQVEHLGKRAVEWTDVNAIASDGWYLLARKEHYEGNAEKAMECYIKADAARGDDKSGVGTGGGGAAKFGIAQMKAWMGDVENAKFLLEKMVQESKTQECVILLGALLADMVFNTEWRGGGKTKISVRNKAVSLLEGVRASWNDRKRKTGPDSSILLYLARLYEDYPEKSLQCLEQVEEIELSAFGSGEDISDEEKDALKKSLREYLPSQLLNNIGCFHYQFERYAEAREYFSIALKACNRVDQTKGEAKSGTENAENIEALNTIISYNLARVYEAENRIEEAEKLYKEIHAKHEGYVDTRARLVYIDVKRRGHENAGEQFKELFEEHSNNIEIRAFYGWHLNKVKKKTLNVAEDLEQKHYKYTLQNLDKHDLYSLTAMGNIYLTVAREMRKDVNYDQEKRQKMYDRAMEFFEKALQIDPTNAYAAQGIAITIAEDKKDLNLAIQIFSQVREATKDLNVYVNVGHAYCELKNYSRAIENYENGLAKRRREGQESKKSQGRGEEGKEGEKDNGQDAKEEGNILTCLGRAWLLKSRQDKKFRSMQLALEYSKQAEKREKLIHLKFNNAFIQTQIGQLVYQLKESEKSLEEVEFAMKGIDEAIEIFKEVCENKNPPFPRSSIEQRANMCKNTIKKQLERAYENQKKYEEMKREKFQKAKELRDAEIKRKEEERREAERLAEEERKRMEDERTRMQEIDRELAYKRAIKEAEVEDGGDRESTTDEETGGRKKRLKKSKSSDKSSRKRRKEIVDSGSDTGANPT